MSSKNKTMLSVAEVFELPVGTKEKPSWVNPGMVGVVREMKEKKMTSGKPYWQVVLADQTGAATLQVSFFNFQRFAEGDLIELSGQGLRRTEYKGTQQVTISEKTDVHILGKSVHHPEQKAAAESGAPSVSGQAQHIAGANVGMATNNAIDLYFRGKTAEEIRAEWFMNPNVQRDLHMMISDICRLSLLVEKGKLAPPIRERLAPKQEATPAPAPIPEKKEPPLQTPEELLESEGDDVPF